MVQIRADAHTPRQAVDLRHLVWRLVYAPGTLRAEARRNGQVIATDEVETAGAPVRIALDPDRTRLHADGNDLSFVTVSVLDSTRVAVPTADQLIRFEVTGDARIAGVDNGDQISHEPFQTDHVRLFNGKALVIVRSGRTAGTVTLTATAEGLGTTSVRLAMERR